MADGQGSMPWPSTPWSCRHTDWLLMGSGLDDAGKAGLKRLAAVAGARLVESWCHGVTHVVCRTDAGQRARRTMKYLMGVAHGCWVVDCAWVAACLSLGGAAPEASYQVHGDSNGGMGGPAAGRSRLASGGLAVLSGYTLMLAGPFSAQDDLVALLKASGAILLSRAPSARGSTRGLPEVIVAANPPRRAAKLARTDAAVSANAGASGGGCEDAATEAKGTPLALYDGDCCAATGIEPQLAGAAAVRAGMPLVSYKWVLECVGSQSYRDWQPFKL
ncbi:BRCT domain-containing protein [Haematococcus lacustris]